MTMPEKMTAERLAEIRTFLTMWNKSPLRSNASSTVTVELLAEVDRLRDTEHPLLKATPGLDDYLPDPMPRQLAAHDRRIAELMEPPLSYVVVAKDPEPEGIVYRTVGVDFATRERAEHWKAEDCDANLPHPAWPGRSYLIAEVRVPSDG